MKILKNIFTGFFVSFLGSLPMGYLNLVGFEIYSKTGIKNLLLYLLGVVFVEGFVIYYTLIFSRQLLNNKKIMRFFDFFSIFFLLFIAYSFYSYADKTGSISNYSERYWNYSTFWVGLFLSAINFMQIPFWTGWNLYLMNSGFISSKKRLVFFYIFGTLLGTFSGMFCLILVLNSVFDTFSNYLFPVIIPLFFIVLAGFQIKKVLTKYL